MKRYNEYIDNRGWHRMKHLMVRTTLAEAQKDLDEYAAKKGWTGIANKAIAE